MPSKASEFKKRSQNKRQIIDITLPSGLSISVRKPAPAWFLYHQSLPRTIIETQAPTQQDVEGAVKLSEWIRALLDEVIVAPKITLNPGPEEISPTDIDDEDLKYIIDWSMGEVKEVDGKSASLAEFPEKSAGTGAGSDSQDVAVSPV